MSTGRRRVLFIIPTLTGGGAERVVVTLLRHLDRRRFDLTLAVVDTRQAAFLAHVPDDVPLIDLQSSRVRHALPKIVGLIWRQRPDVVLSTLGHLNLALAMIRPLLPGATRYIARETIVVSEGIQSYSRPGLWAWAYRRFYGRFDHVICQSRDMRDDLVDRLALDRRRTTVINNPVDIDAVAAAAALGRTGAPEPGPRRPGPRALHLVAAGRLEHQKGFDLLIEAMALATNRELHLTLLGEGPLRDSLKGLARERGVADRIEFAGFQPNPYPFFARADGFVLSSRFEGFPNVVLEALACGTAVVALPAPGGVREILGDVEGCVIADDMSASSLARALDRYTPARIPRSVVDRFGVARITEQYASALECPSETR